MTANLRPVPNQDDGGRVPAGRVPPNNLEAEESLLGAMLLGRDAIASAVDLGLSGADFYKPAHGHIFESVMRLHAKGEPADATTVPDDLARAGLLEGIGGPQTITALQLDTPSIGNARRYAVIVKEYSTLRQAIGVAGEIAQRAYDLPADVPAFLDAAETLIGGLRPEQRTVTGRPIRDGLMERIDELEALIEGGGVVERPTGFQDLDDVTGGWHPSELTLIAGRPGTGKSSLGLALARNAAKLDAAVAVVSVEMGEKSLLDRLIASEAQIVGSDLRKGKVAPKDHMRLGPAVGRLAELPIWVIDAAAATLLTVRAEVHKARRHYGRLDLVIVDYVQIMRAAAKVENRQVEVAQLAQGLRALARELRIPVVALAQLSRNLETRADKRPVLADLRESGDLENTADTVIGIYRPDAAEREPKDEDRGVAELIVLKQREGPCETVRLSADLATGRWGDLSRREAF